MAVGQAWMKAGLYLRTAAMYSGMCCGCRWLALACRSCSSPFQIVATLDLVLALGVARAVVP